MTPSNHPVQRVTCQAYNTLRSGSRKARKIVVRIDGEVIRFREQRGRKWFDLPTSFAFQTAVRCSAGFRVCFVPGPKKK